MKIEFQGRQLLTANSKYNASVERVLNELQNDRLFVRLGLIIIVTQKQTQNLKAPVLVL